MVIYVCNLYFELCKKFIDNHSKVVEHNKNVDLLAVEFLAVVSYWSKQAQQFFHIIKCRLLC